MSRMSFALTLSFGSADVCKDALVGFGYHINGCEPRKCRENGLSENLRGHADISITFIYTLFESLKCHSPQILHPRKSFKKNISCRLKDHLLFEEAFYIDFWVSSIFIHVKNLLFKGNSWNRPWHYRRQWMLCFTLSLRLFRRSARPVASRLWPPPCGKNCSNWPGRSRCEISKKVQDGRVC